MIAKIFINENARSYLEDKANIISKIYFLLTNRKISLEFKAETSFVQLPKVKVQKKAITKKTEGRKKVSKNE